MFLAAAHETLHAPPDAVNIGVHSVVFKDFVVKYDTENIELCSLPPPAGRDIPKRAVSLGQSGLFGKTDIGQTGCIQPTQRLPLAMGDKAKVDGFNQTVEGALHLDVTDRHRGGGDRGEHDLSFQGH
jgi:hypothetical protein